MVFFIHLQFETTQMIIKCNPDTHGGIVAARIATKDITNEDSLTQRSMH